VLLTELPDETMAILLECLEAAPSKMCGFGMITMGGAVGRVADDATAFSGRGANWWLTIEALWDDPAGDRSTSRGAVNRLARLGRVALTANYVNDLGEPGENDLRDVYGTARYDRLVTLKRAWDPDNVFRLNPERGALTVGDYSRWFDGHVG
jgi:hypothetical protein